MAFIRWAMSVFIHLIVISFTDDTKQLFKHFFIRRTFRVKRVHQLFCFFLVSGEEVEVGRNAISAGDYEAQGHVSSLRTVFAVTAAKRSVATT